MDLSIIIINYNLSNETKECVVSLLDNTSDIDFEIILVDNNSEDKSIIKVAEEFSQNKKLNFTFIRTEKNIGFGNACNLAVKKSSGKWLFFLNPDTIIKDNIFQEIYIELNKDCEKKGIIGLNVNSSKIMDYSAGYFPNYLFEILNICLLGRYFEAICVKINGIISRTKKLNVDWVMGAALFIEKQLFEEINGFDPDYFLYFEEMDLCKRVINKELPVNYFSNIKIEHRGGASSKRNYYFLTKMFYKGKLLFIKKHSKESAFSIYKILFLFTIINQIAFWWILKFTNKEKSSGKIRAFREILKYLDTPEKITNRTFNE